MSSARNKVFLRRLKLQVAVFLLSQVYTMYLTLKNDIPTNTDWDPKSNLDLAVDPSGSCNDTIPYRKSDIKIRQYKIGS